MLALQISKNSPEVESYKIVKGFYELLEKSRCLEDIAVDYQSESGSAEAEPNLVRSLRELVSSVEEKISQETEKKKNFLVKMKLLEAFLKDLEDVELESAIEKAWIKEVKALMNDVNHAIRTFNQRKDGWGLLNLNSWFAQTLFSAEVQSLAKALDELLEAKEKYGFQYIRRQQKSQPYDKDLGVLRNQIDALLTEISDKPEKPIKDRKDLHDILTNMKDKLVKKVEEIEGASEFRSICLKQMNETIFRFQQRIEDKEGSVESLNISQVKDAMNDIERNMKAYSKVSRKPSPTIGMKDHTETLCSWLTNDNGYIHSIVGMQGIGKTTLAKKVYHHEDIAKKFPLRIWVSVPEHCNNDSAFWKLVSTKIIKHDEPPGEEGRRKEDWVQNIHNFLKDKKYLLVLDNISKKEIWDIQKVKVAFSESFGSKILLTTRCKAVADQSTNHQLELQLLCMEESWELFEEKIRFQPELLSQVERRSKAKEIVAKCGGLPTTILRLGLQMSGKNPNDLGLISERILNKHKERIWSRHFNNTKLPKDLRNLVTYFTIFPPGFEIPVRRLIALWIAEDLVKESEELEQTLDKYLMQLVGLNLIQPVKKNVEGKLKTCRLPSALLDVLPHPTSDQQSADQDGNFDNARIYKRNLRRDDLLSKSSNHGRSDGNLKLIDGSGTFSSPGKEPLTFISFDTRPGDEPGKGINNVLCTGIANGCFRKLKVLDLERVFRPHLPESIGYLIKLKYLGLRWTYLQEIPKSIGKLQNLQTLDLKHTYIRTLPSTIWYLEKLRHLYLNHAYWSKFERQTKKKMSMQHLWTLWGLFLYENNPIKEWLQELRRLRKLDLAFELKRDQQEKLFTKVSELKHLQTLRLRSILRTRSPEGSGATPDLWFVNLSKLESLSSLYLFGKLNTTNALSNSLPRSLCDLTLSASELQVDPMDILKELPNLRSLSLFSNSFKGGSMNSSSKSFPSLSVLKLWKLDHLKTWNIEEQAMENLEELEIRSCENLEIPNGLKQLKTLRQLNLRNMPNEFTETLRLNKKPTWDSISNMPAITVADLTT